MMVIEDSEGFEKVLNFLEATDSDNWCLDRVRTEDDKNCVMGHIFSMGGDDNKSCNDWWNWFENTVATTYMIYPVNDGKNPKYPQSTPKERCIAYIKDIRDGKESSTWQIMDEEYADWKSRENVT